MYESVKEILRFAWAHEDKLTVHTVSNLEQLIFNGGEPIRPYDEGIARYLYGMSDANHADPQRTETGSKSMGGYAIMLASAVIDWKAWRFHTLTTDITSGETLAASRLAARLVYFNALLRFLGAPPTTGTPLLSDNDGVWYVARDATTVTKMTYVIRHVRFIQQTQHQDETKVYQVDGKLNPVDTLSKWLDACDRVRHYLFLMGKPTEARTMWRLSKAFASYKAKRIVAVPSDGVVADNTAA